MRTLRVCFIGMTAAGLVASCGGSSTEQRERSEPPAARPNADVGKDAASRDAALRRQDPEGTVRPAVAEPPPDPGTPAR